MSQLAELSNGLITCVSRFGDADLFYPKKSSVTVAGVVFRSNRNHRFPSLLTTVPSSQSGNGVLLVERNVSGDTPRCVSAFP